MYRADKRPCLYHIEANSIDQASVAETFSPSSSPTPCHTPSVTFFLFEDSFFFARRLAGYRWY